MDSDAIVLLAVWICERATGAQLSPETAFGRHESHGRLQARFDGCSI
jgi:hypothetical protein